MIGRLLLAAILAMAFSAIYLDFKHESEQVAGYQWKCWPKKCHRDSPA